MNRNKEAPQWQMAKSIYVVYPILPFDQDSFILVGSDDLDSLGRIWCLS